MHSAHRLTQTLHLSRGPLPLTDPLPGVTPETIDAERGWAWFEAEIDVLISLVPAAAQAGFDTSAWQLTWCMTMVPDWTDHRHEWVEAAALDSLASARRKLGDLPGAIAASERSVELIAATGSRMDEAIALCGLGDAHHAAGNREQARQAWLHSLALYEHIEDGAADSVRKRLTEWAAAPSSG